MSVKREIVVKIAIVYGFMLLFALAILARIVSLQFIGGEKWKEMQVGNNSKDLIVVANRGDILASDGRMLASSIPSYDIHMDFRAQGLSSANFRHNVDSLSICLSKLMRDKSASAYRSRLMRGFNKGSRYYKVLSRRVSYTELKQIKGFPLFRMGANRGGFIATQYNTRKLPFGVLGARTIGNLNFEKDRGIVGIENAFNEQLKGVDGVSMKKKISGRWLKLNIVEPKDGMDIVSTIDIDLQDVAENALLQQLKKHDADHGCAVLMEVETGHIRAIANLGRTSSGRYDERYNYAIGEASDPGSTFKLASMIVALEDGVVELSDTIDTGNGIKHYYKVPMEDSHEGGYGKITVQEVFEKSSNVGTSLIINNNYAKNPQRFIDRIHALGIGEPLGLDIAGEAKPYIKSPDDKSWSGISLPWMSIGYELTLAPIHTLALFNAVANGGKMVKPQFVQATSYHGEVVDEFDVEVINSSICSRQTLKKIKLMMEGVVTEGTALNLKNSHYSIAGKTGTAQIAHGKTGYRGVNGRQYNASFCGYFPADDPKYSCIVVVNSPSRNVFYGNVVAGNVFREIADKVFVQNLEMQKQENEQELDIKYKVPVTMDGSKVELLTVFDKLDVENVDKSLGADWVLTSNKGAFVEVNNLTVNERMVPNVQGMGAKDALFLLENANLKVYMSGVGRVVKQSLLPGTRITSRRVIEIELR